jgi:hypothetical protein
MSHPGVAGLLVIGLVTCAIPVVTNGAAPPAQGAPRNDYTRPETWLCRPGLPASQDACAVDLTTTVVTAEGRLTREAFAAHPNPPIDCFYVYPTVSLDPGGNSDMIAGAEERNVIRSQFARFASQCRPFAPLYRQFTLTALRANTAGTPIEADRTIGYNDVLDAWNHYLAHDNGGRGVVLVGHSQGAGVLAQLIRNAIDGQPVQSRVVSALLLGTNVAVPRGKDTGGTFQHMPICRSATQTGCVMTYVTFRSTIPPPPDSRFGRVAGEEMEAACTNPAAPAGGTGQLHAYLTSGGGSLLSPSSAPMPWVTPPATIDTPFVSLPGLLTAQCVSNEKGSYLEVTVNGDPHDPRTDDIPGDVLSNGKPVPSWGLHVIDVQVAMGNLLDVVAQQARAYRSR